MYLVDKINPRNKSYGKFWYDLLKSIFIAVKLSEALLIMMYSHEYKKFTNNSLLSKHMKYYWQYRINFFVKD